MNELLGPVFVIGGAVAGVTGILKMVLMGLSRFEARIERQVRERIIGRHYGRDERP